MTFCMGPQTHACARKRILQALHIALEGIQVQYQRWGIDFIKRVADMGSFPGGHN
jgi:hypothetical protein